ncbi:MAG TPA: TRAP transporter small permease subunit [Bacilli bacterium]|nr:TRAP transporter small permease subunit [Bacilli bacterium]
MNRMLKIYEIFEVIKKIGLFISGISILGMAFLIFYDVLVRNLFSGSIRGGFEIVQNYFMPLVVFPSLAFVYSSGVIPKMDIIIGKLGDKEKKYIIFIMLLLEIFILILIVQFSWQYAMNGLERKIAFPAAGTLYPLYPVLFTIPIAFALITIENIFIFIRNILEKKPTLLVIDKEGELEGF